ncbi:MAG: phage head-tail connector protein [Clostridiales bacterium]|nr:phage head-tail connector protein [Clostridiales bacterium]
MSDKITAALLADLAERLGTGEEDTLLVSCLSDAAAEVQLYLGWTDEEWAGSVPAAIQRKVVQLAALYYRRDSLEAEQPGVASTSVTEDKLSQSVSYRSADSYAAQESAILQSLARYRRVSL